MSEYQYYDFRAIDRPLTGSEMAKLRSISTRAEITKASFTNHYEWGDLKADPIKLLAKYFDAFVHVTNFGFRKFCIRLPKESVDFKLLSSSSAGEAFQASKAGDFIILEFLGEYYGEEDWDDGAGWMASLMPLRTEVLRGDLRSLYLGWLLCAQNEELNEDEMEPSVPAGLGDLSAPLHALVEFLRIDEDLIEVAAQTSQPLQPPPRGSELAAWIRRLSESDKTDVLISAASSSNERWRIDLLRRYERDSSQADPRPAQTAKRRTVADLLSSAKARADERTRRLNKKRAKEEAQRKAEEEKNRARYLDQLEAREPAVWNEIAVHIQTRQPKGYDSAVSLLTDLRDLAVRRGDTVKFKLAVQQIREKHSAKESFLRRLAKVTL